MSDAAVQAASSFQARAERRNRLIGIGLMCAALMCFSCLDASAKWLNRSMDPLLTVWWRYVSSVVLVSFAINPWTRPGVLRTNRMWVQVARSLLLFLSTACNFVALQYMQLAETISIIFSTPLMVALLAGPLLGEWIGPRRLVAIGVGFVGVLVVTRPGVGTMHPAALLSVAGSVAYAFYAITTRVLAAHDSSQTTMVYSGLAGVVLMTPLLPFVWTTPATPLAWFLVVAIGVFGAVGHWLLILAHARAPAPILSPFIYTQIVWMLALGYVLFGDWPDHWTLAGSSIVIASGLYLIYRERARKLA
jgi:drug/metabolite transporter (DMT)-like permease